MDQLRKELDIYSSTISTLLRAINLGVLGITWALLLRTADVLPVADQIPRTSLFVAAAGALMALLTDLFQYFAAESAAGSAYDRAATSATGSGTLNRKSLAYRAQLCCYWTKRLLTVAAAFWLVAWMVRVLA